MVLYRGSQIHDDLLASDVLERNSTVMSHLVSMYAKCGAFAKAQQAFDDIQVRDIISWNALISGYCQHGYGEEALCSFEAMKYEGFSPDLGTFLCILRACRSAGCEEGRVIHEEIIKADLLRKDNRLGNALVNMYCKCGSLVQAKEVFDELPVQNVVSWTALITGYCQSGHGRKALFFYEQMRCEGLSPDPLTLACILKACGNLGAIEKGKELHADILREGLLGHDTVLGTALLDMYAKCGALAEAKEVFDELLVPNIVAWNALIAGYSQHGYGGEALKLFQQLKRDGFSPNSVTYLCILTACGCIGNADEGSEIHAEICHGGLLRKNIALGNGLVNMYAKCGALKKAQEVFDELPVKDSFTWNALIAGCCQHGHGEEALHHFSQMLCEGLSPDAVTFVCMLNACGTLCAVDKGKKIHAEILREDLLRKNSLLGTALMDMYAKCGEFGNAQQAFDDLSIWTVVSWNALIGGYAQHGCSEAAAQCFERMQWEGFSPNEVTFACILKSCSSNGVGEKGTHVHIEILKQGLLGQNNVLCTALVDMYAKCGELQKAQKVFDSLPLLDVCSWNALISGYFEHGHGEEALDCLKRMQGEGYLPDATTFTCILKICASIGAPEKGKEVHDNIVKSKLLQKFNLLGVGLVNMYAKCGAVAKAQELFDELCVRDVIVWTTLMAGYYQVCKFDSVFESFTKMLAEGISPDLVTFSVVLNACSCSGLQNMGLKYFESMSLKHGIQPMLEHYTCMINLFGHAGSFERATTLIKKMPSLEYFPLWFSLLAACKSWGNVDLGRLAFEQAVRLDESSSIAYVCMSDIYSAAGLEEKSLMQLSM